MDDQEHLRSSREESDHLEESLESRWEDGCQQKPGERCLRALGDELVDLGQGEAGD